MKTKIKIKSRAKAHLSAALLLPVLLLSGIASQAAVVDAQSKDWGKGGKAVCCDANYKANFKEVKADEKGGAKAPHTFLDGQSQSFELRHRGDTGELFFSIGGSPLLTIDLADNTGWETIGLQIKVGGDKKNVVTLSDIKLVSGAYPANDPYTFPTVLSVPDGKDKTQALILTENGLDENGLSDGREEYFANFTLTGILVFDWAGKKAPKGGDIEFKIGVADQVAVPVPAAFWLFGSALGFLGWQHRRSAS